MRAVILSVLVSVLSITAFAGTSLDANDVCKARVDSVARSTIEFYGMSYSTVNLLNLEFVAETASVRTYAIDIQTDNCVVHLKYKVNAPPVGECTDKDIDIGETCS